MNKAEYYAFLLSAIEGKNSNEALKYLEGCFSSKLPDWKLNVINDIYNQFT